MDAVTRDLNRHLNAIDDREAREETIKSELERVETHIQAQRSQAHYHCRFWRSDPGQLPDLSYPGRIPPHAGLPLAGSKAAGT